MARKSIKPQSYSGRFYHRGNQPLKPRKAQPRLGPATRRLLGGLLIILLLAGLWRFSTFSGINITTTAEHDTTLVRQSLASSLSGWGRFKLLFDPATASAAVLAADSAVADIELGWTAVSGTLEARVTPRQAQALVVQGSQRLGFIDQQGVFYTDGTETLTLPEIADSTGIEPASGQSFAPLSAVEFIRKFENALEGLPPSLVESRRYQLTTSIKEIQLASALAYTVRLNIERSAADQSQELAQAIEYLQANQLNPSVIDLRINDTAYFR